jgi:hypothetical protein
VLALAYLLWRTLHLMRTQARWERRALAFLLQELAGGRGGHPAPTPRSLNQFQRDLHRLTRHVGWVELRLQRLRKHFEALWTALFDPERWRRLAQHIGAPPASQVAMSFLAFEEF